MDSDISTSTYCLRLFIRYGTPRADYLHWVWSSSSLYYRSTRMHSADYAVARCLSDRPSVCLSHVGILSETAKHIIKLFPLRGSRAHHSSLSVPNGITILRRGPPNGGVECKGVLKNRNFLTNMLLYLGNDITEAWLLWKANRKPYPGFLTVQLSTTLNDPYPRFQGYFLFPFNSNYSPRTHRLAKNHERDHPTNDVTTQSIAVRTSHYNERRTVVYTFCITPDGSTNMKQTTYTGKTEKVLYM